MASPTFEQSESKPRRILVTGDRKWRDARVIEDALSRAFREAYWGRVVVVHGDAPGADTYAEVICQLWGVKTEPHPADWNKDGKSAGPIRNQKMLDSGVDLVIAFHDDLENSKGTKHMVEIAEKAGIKVIKVKSQKAREKIGG